MRRVITTGLMACLLLATMAQAVVAQGEDEAMGADLAYYEPVEVSEAGVVISLPPEWGVTVRMERQEYDLPVEFADAAPVFYTEVLTADSGSGDWCDLNVHPDIPLSLDEQVARDEAILASSVPAGYSVIAAATMVADGPGHQIDLVEEGSPDLARVYLFETDGVRFVLSCLSHSGDDRHWQSIADLVRPLGMESEAEEKTEPDDPIEPVTELQRVELDEAGVALTLPGDWEILPETEYVGPDYLPDGPEIAEVDMWRVLRAYPTAGVWCSIFTYDGIQLPLDDHAATFKQNVEIDILGPPSRTAEVERVPLPIGDAVRLTVTHEDGGVVNTYLFDVDGDRAFLECGAPSQPDDAWLSVAESIEPLGGEPPVAEPQRFEVEEARMAIMFPPAWHVSVKLETEEMGLSTEDGGPLYVTTVLEAASYGAGCMLYHYEDSPFTIVEHAAGNTAKVLQDPDFRGEMEEDTVWLPAGEAMRSVVEKEHKGLWVTSYLMEAGNDRYLLTCGDFERAADDYLSIAETFEFLGEGIAPDTPEGASFWSEVSQFGTQFPVLDQSIEASLMSAWCDRALWFEFPDGTFEERDECRLTIDPVEPPEAQAAWPEETVNLSGGACEWTSDYWVVSDGSEVWASSWSVTVEADGTATATSWYEADELDCEG